MIGSGLTVTEMGSEWNSTLVGKLRCLLRKAAHSKCWSSNVLFWDLKSIEYLWYYLQTGNLYKGDYIIIVKFIIRTDTNAFATEVYILS